MFPSLRPRAFYGAFDRFPSRKGAAVHIDRFARALFSHFEGRGLLYVLGGEGLPAYQREDQVEIVRFSRPVPNFLARVLGYQARLAALLDAAEAGGSLEICHFRDPWTGVPVLARSRGYACVYEVNGLPSIELPLTYPALDAGTLDKIRADERRCWTEADLVVVPAVTVRDMLLRLGCDGEKIAVVPNGADLREGPPPARPVDAPRSYLLYFGALQPWQGMATLLRAFARLADFPDLHLVVCASHASRELVAQQRFATRLGVADRMIWRVALEEAELASWRAHALASVAPLTECARNVLQGCAPLKVLESMAEGVPVVASDLASVREIITDGHDGRLVPADRPADLARALRLLVEYPDERARLGGAARHTIGRRFRWEDSLVQLRQLYDGILQKRRMAC
jgi:glycosyltransferase involved in cell wall biosynthesis